MITVLCGGVGGSRFLRAVAAVVSPDEITAVVNTGDDHEFHGLHVSPDPDIVTYALAGAVDESRGWGFRDETFRWNQHLARYGRETWFQIGDRDLATHLYRTERLRAGASLSDCMREIAAAFDLRARLLPMSDDRVRTVVETDSGDLAFQRYLVQRRARDRVVGVRFEGAEKARPAPGVIEAIASAEAIFIAPSNPIGSIWPILSVPGIRDAIETSDAPCIAISPIVGGRSLQPPAAEMLSGLGFTVDPAGVANAYAGLIDLLIIDESDEEQAGAVTSLGVRVVVARTVMADDEARRELATVALATAGVDGGS